MKRILVPIFACMVLFSCSENNAPSVSQMHSGDEATKYQIATVEKEPVSLLIKLPAQLAAYEEVSIFPKVNGYVKSVHVDIGSEVSQGQLLMTLEAPELEQASVQAKEKYERTKADFSIDKEHYQRLLEAAKTAGAISPLDLSAIKSKMEADSSLGNAERANWQVQETMLGYLRVTAPFNGVITERNVNRGELISAAEKDKPMLELKQISHLRLQVDVPEDVAATLNNRDTVAFYLDAFPGKAMTAHISRISNSINMQYRSERIEIDVDNKDKKLTPGMYAEVELHDRGNANAVCVPSSAVVTSTERKYVIAIRNNITVKVNVETRNQSNNKTEVIGSLQPGEKVISNASDEMKEGVKI